MYKVLYLLFILCFNYTEFRSPRDLRQDCEERCDEDVLMNYLADLQVLSPETIISLPLEDVDQLCRKLDEHIKTIDKFARTCRPPPPEDLYMSLIQGVKVLNLKMCSADSEFLKKFLVYYPCMHELKNDYEGCNGPADWNEEPNEHKICISYKHIVDCYYVETAKVCGLEAAKTIKELVLVIIDSVICIRCPEVLIDPYVKDVMPEKFVKIHQMNPLSKGETSHICSYIIIFSLILTIM